MADSDSNGIETLIGRVKEALLKLEGDEIDHHFLVSASAYDTAWLAMVPNHDENIESKPMFEGCLDWILKNQRPEGFWGERDYLVYPTLDSLPSTLACMVALKTWGVGHHHIQKAMAFISSTSAKLLLDGRQDKRVNYPRWFTIVFPGMVQIACEKGLQLTFSDDIKEVVADVFHQRHLILETEKQGEENFDYPPVLAYLEALPCMFKIDHSTILENLDENGSLFRSPSATAGAFLITGNHRMLSYIRRLLPNCNNGVPSMFPVDVDSIRLYMAHEIQRLGLLEHFPKEIKEISQHIYSMYNKQEEPPQQRRFTIANVFKDSLAFELLRLQGYKVSPRRLCWLLNDERALEYIEDNYEKCSTMLYSLYKATNLMFQGEEELQELRSFTRRLLERSCLCTTLNDGITMWPHLLEMIKHELSTPWMARMDHLENRKWIEEKKRGALWLGKASYYRIPFIDNEDLLQLASKNFEYRQSVYKKELQELIRWCKASNLTNLGFARDKTVYLYFAVASSISLPCDFDVRMIVAKAAILITVADDFFDMEGSLDELQILMNAVRRWDNKDLSSHGKIIFDALDKTVSETAEKYLNQHGVHIMNELRQIWCETFNSWMTEATWSKLGLVPSMATYLETGMISIAAHILIVQASCTFTPLISPKNLNARRYEEITKFLMISCRLLNDLQSYEKELKDGKSNAVMLYLKHNPSSNLVDAINYVQSMLDEAKMKVLEHSLIEYLDDLPNSFKKLHLGCLKVFQMFFNATNHFDAKDSLFNDINKAIVVPLELNDEKNIFRTLPRKSKTPLSSPSKKKVLTPVSNGMCYIHLKKYLYGRRSPFTISSTTPQRTYQVTTVIKSPCNLRFV